MKTINLTLRRRIMINITLLMTLLSLFIGLGIGFVLPSYYTAYQMKAIKAVTGQIREGYGTETYDEIVDRLLDLQAMQGGDLYELSVTGKADMGPGMGKGRMGQATTRGSLFEASGDITEYTYTNKLGIEIYAFGVKADESYLVYEVDIQSLDDATSVMIRFSILLLALSIIMGLILSHYLAKKISAPITRLNKLTTQMMTKRANPHYVTKHQDEIYELNGAINRLYEELQANIYQLESELAKERNTELLKKRFLAQATHELKTPIAVIAGYAELLSDHLYQSDQEHDHYVASIYEESGAMGHIIEDILDYTKMETGNFTLKRQEVDMNRMITTLGTRYKDFAASKGLGLTLDLGRLEKTYWMDPSRLEQVIKNLLANAMEHAKNQVTLSGHDVGGKLLLKVKNDGPAIEEEDLPYLFDSFYKGKGKKTGTGLGLAIVKQIVLLHGGDYHVANEEDGPVFSILV